MRATLREDFHKKITNPHKGQSGTIVSTFNNNTC